MYILLFYYDFIVLTPEMENKVFAGFEAGEYDVPLVDNVRNGKGTQKLKKDGVEYTLECTWKDGKKNGEGVLLDNNYVMAMKLNFVDDVAEGEGYLYTNGQVTFKGNWKNLTFQKVFPILGNGVYTTFFSGLSDLFAFYEESKKFVEENSNGNSQKDLLATEIKKIEKEVLIRADAISKKRKAVAAELQKQVDEILGNLGMSGTRFGVSITEKDANAVEQKCGPYGKDNIEFLISANPGNPMLPLAKIASGGELSRVMLALKTIFAQADSVETLIFDEIDTGIGGEVAVAVGAHMKKLAKNRQIFCITHLASIAVYADNQIKIEKSVSGEITSSNVYPVTGEKRVAEIARMLSGDSDTEQSLEHARSMLLKYSGEN